MERRLKARHARGLPNFLHPHRTLSFHAYFDLCSEGPCGFGLQAAIRLPPGCVVGTDFWDSAGRYTEHEVNSFDVCPAWFVNEASMASGKTRYMDMEAVSTQVQVSNYMFLEECLVTLRWVERGEFLHAWYGEDYDRVGYEAVRGVTDWTRVGALMELRWAPWVRGNESFPNMVRWTRERRELATPVDLCDDEEQDEGDAEGDEEEDKEEDKEERSEKDT